ncbi:hypothetical protein HHI36_017098 [Cryptolaemus montrouzieri]|uniref:Uncharacterized protein n=1 Tax=Cryptolaemus montrouzieri TaxID=559131 RepID=A0ABD2NLL5_9CUCU
MKVNRLLSDELAYELSIRKLPSSGNVADKRFDLREALRAEKAEERRQDFENVEGSRVAALRRSSTRLDIERCPQHARNEEAASGLSGSTSSINDENFSGIDSFPTFANASGVAPSDTKVCDITNKPFEPHHKRISFGTIPFTQAYPRKSLIQIL